MRDSAIKAAFSPLTRPNVVRVGSGFQQVSDFRDIYGTLPYLQIADPNDPHEYIDVSALRMTAQPLKPPVVRVTDLKGRFTVLDDSLYFSGIRASLAASRMSQTSGRYNFDNNDLRLRLRGDTVSTNDLLWIDPNIPQDGTGSLGSFALDWIGPVSDYQGKNASLALGGTRLSGDLGIQVTDTLAFHDTDLKFSNLDTRTIQQLFPTLKSPRQGYLTGRMAAAGGFGAMRVDGDVAFDDPRTGTSRIIALGTVGASNGVFRATELHVTLAPFRVALAKVAVPSLPIGGTVTGKALINGSTARGLTASGDLTHNDVTGTSRVDGTVTYTTGRVPLLNANLRLAPAIARDCWRVRSRRRSARHRDRAGEGEWADEQSCRRDRSDDRRRRLDRGSGNGRRDIRCAALRRHSGEPSVRRQRRHHQGAAHVADRGRRGARKRVLTRDDKCGCIRTRAHIYGG